MEIQNAPCKGAIFRGKDMPGHAQHTAVSWAKISEPIEIPFGLCGLWTRVGPRQHVLHGVHIGATWQTSFNCPRAAVMRATLTTCSYYQQDAESACSGI